MVFAPARRRLRSNRCAHWKTVAPPRAVQEQLGAALAELLSRSDAGSAVQRRNLLLDRCGSDHRPLVELLLRVGRHGTEQTLREMGPVAAHEWPARRAATLDPVVAIRNA